MSQVGYLNQGTLLRSSLDEVGAGHKKTDHSEVLERTCMEVELQDSQKRSIKTLISSGPPGDDG